MSYEAEQACFIKYKNKIEDLAGIITIISCVISTISFIFKCFDIQSFKFPGRLATTALFLSVLFSFTLLIGTITDYKQIDINSNNPFYSNLCIIQAIFFQFIAIALSFHWTLIGFVTYLVVVKRYSVRSFINLEKKLNICCWIITFLLTFCPIIVSGLKVYGPSSGLSACYLQVRPPCLFFSHCVLIELSYKQTLFLIIYVYTIIVFRKMMISFIGFLYKWH